MAITETNKTKGNNPMKTKLALLAALTLIGLGTTRALIGSDRDKTAPSTTAVETSTAKGCCAMKETAPAPVADKDAAATTGMSCHSNAAAKEAAPVKTKSCCNK